MYEITYARPQESPRQSPGVFTRSQAVNEIDALLASGADIATVYRSTSLKPSGGVAPAKMAALLKIIAKRDTQIDAGHTPEHDDTHTGEELALAAATYTFPEEGSLNVVVQRSFFWPWKPEEFNGNADRLDQLTEAGALILAEMERIIRLRNREG